MLLERGNHTVQLLVDVRILHLEGFDLDDLPQDESPPQALLRLRLQLVFQLLFGLVLDLQVVGQRQPLPLETAIHFVQHFVYFLFEQRRGKMHRRPTDDFVHDYRRVFFLSLPLSPLLERLSDFDAQIEQILEFTQVARQIVGPGGDEP